MKRKGQSVTEYAILLGVAIAVFAGMQTYVKRGLNARIRAGADVATSAGADMVIDLGIEGDNNYTLTMSNQSQYEPYYQYSKTQTYSENVMKEHLDGDGRIKKEIVSSINAQAAGSVRGDRVGKSARDQADAMWDK